MVNSPKIERINALDPYFPKNKKLNGKAKIDFELIRDFKLNQIVTWPTKMNNLKKYFKSLSVNSDYLKPGIVCQYGGAHVVRVEPYKWWVLNDYSNVFGGIDRAFVMDIDLSHSFVQIKISGIFSTRVLTHFVPVDIREKQFHNKLQSNSNGRFENIFYKAIGHAWLDYYDSLNFLSKNSDILDYGCGIGPTIEKVINYKPKKIHKSVIKLIIITNA